MSRTMRCCTFPRNPLASLILLVAIGAVLGGPTAMGQRPRGLDISAWQGDLSPDCWNEIYNAGYRFALIRVTHFGVSNGDPDTFYAQNIERAANAGLLVGTYHYAIWSRTPQVEANYFLSYATPYITAGYLPPMLDLESKDNPGAPVGATSVCDWARQWVNIVKAATGVEPGVYVSGGSIGNYCQAPAGCSCGGTCTCCLVSQPLWVADWCGDNVCTACGNMDTAQPEYGTGFWPTWTFWQYCSKGSISCISGNVDMDIFNGTMAELQCKLIGADCHTPPVISNVQASSITDAGVTIGWITDTASTSQVEYGLTGSYGSSSPLNNTPVTAHSIPISGLNAKTLYHYRVISSNAYGTTYSPDYTFATSGPPIISNVAATGITENSATVTWTTDTAATGQANYGLTASYGSTTPFETGMPSNHTITIHSLQPSTLYHYQAVSTNPYGVARSDDFTFRTLAAGSSTIVDNTSSNCLVTGTWTRGTSAVHIGTDYLWTSGVNDTSEASATKKIRWTPNLSTAGNYDVHIFYAAGTNRSDNVYWKITNAGPIVARRVNQETPGNDWTLLAANVPFNAGSTGYVEVMNNNGDTQVVHGDAVKFVFRGSEDTEPPTVPANLASTTINTASVQLTWNASTDNVGVSGYKVYRNGAVQANSTGTNYLDGGLTPNTVYIYEVSAYDAVPNESSKSSALSRTTLSVPPSVSTVVPNSSTICLGGSATWTAVGGFGPGTVAYYRYTWDQSATHAFNGTESQWSAATLSTAPLSSGKWYLHLQGYNSAQVANGIYNVEVTANSPIRADFNQDCAVDASDFQVFQACAGGSGSPYHSGCPLAADGQGVVAADFDADHDVDQSDFGTFQRCYSGNNVLADPNCAN